MLFLLVAIALTALLGYVLFLLFWDAHKEKDTSFECFSSEGIYIHSFVAEKFGVFAVRRHIAIHTA